jgi:hypothetical protein
MKSNKHSGLYDKFSVHRLDGKDQEGGPKEGAKYFVLDYVNDPLAVFALLAYAHAARRSGFAELYEDLLQAAAEDARLSLFVCSAVEHDLEAAYDRLLRAVDSDLSG